MEENYVTGWLNFSIRSFLKYLPNNLIEKALVTCLDSELFPKKFMNASLEEKGVEVVGNGLLFPFEVLRNVDVGCEYLFGFDEVWLLSSDVRSKPPEIYRLVGPKRLNEIKARKLSSWMSKNNCVLGLGDGVGMNFIVDTSNKELIKSILDCTKFQK